ncbi:RICIN domain-containing protein [Kitasatospora sp. NPDC051914]|uniref:RICIN domain-containing protein n=1 Tax=Kitasatospora sp. NPDC051914 TaxID=3154945 RepID=UPI003432CB1F
MSDPAADPLPDVEHVRRPAAPLLTTRHNDALVAYARRLCRDEQAAQELAEEVFTATLESAPRGTGPAQARPPQLLAAARHTAAAWADTGRIALLSPGFAAWLRTLRRTHLLAPCARAAVTAAEENAALLQVFRKLPDTLQADLWHSLEDATGPTGPPSTAGAPTAELPHPEAVQRFYGAYLRHYVAHAPRRNCRQLVARLGDTVRRDTGDDALDLHLGRCPDCARARADLTVIHTWQRPALREALLLWTGDHEPEPEGTAVLPATPTGPPPSAPQPGPPVPVPPPAVPDDPAATGTPSRRPSDRTVRLGLCVLGLGVLTVAAATVAPHRAAPTAAAPPPPSASPAVSRATPPPVPSPTAPVPSTPATPAPDDNSPASGSPTADDAPPPSPTPRIAAFRLVNVRTGLCVSPDGQDGAGVHLATCDGSVSQRWRFPRSSSDGLLQVRNAADGRCLDGTTEGGNVVTVVLRECRADRREQLWRAVGSKGSAAFRLHFAPCVAKSDYTDHLLGPGDIWPGPAEAGSPLVHQPNYYDKDDFLFTTD